LAPSESDPQKAVFDPTNLPRAQAPREVSVGPGQTFNLSFSKVGWSVGGKTLPGISYGGSIPGPVLRVQQGSKINLVFDNQTDMQTTLHPHGLRLDYRFDGVPYVGQDPIEPGDPFKYELEFPDPGVYWYHPHVRDWSIRDMGAYGVFVVEPKDPDYYNPVNREEVLALDDVLVNNPAGHPTGMEHPTHVLAGLFGDTMVVNGRTDYALNVKKGEVVRFHVLNAADARPFRLTIPGARIKVVGSDIGKSEREEYSDSVMISPAERYTLEVLFDQPGAHAIYNTPTRGPQQPLGVVNVSDVPVSTSYADAFNTLRVNTDVVSEIDTYRPLFDKPVDKRLELTLAMPKASTPSTPSTTLDKYESSDNPGPGRFQTWSERGGTFPWGETWSVGGEDEVPSLWERSNLFMFTDNMGKANERATPENTHWSLIDPDTGASNMGIRWAFKTGEVVKVEMKNNAMQHPIHFHGQRFLVLSMKTASGQVWTNPNLQWKDTVFIPPGQTAQILMEASNPGKWMFHCHIGRHAIDVPEHRMMGNFEVNETGIPSQGGGGHPHQPS
jgi:FtsP/CotA-like multicopper oxidase with cupredoxin domain